MVSLMPKKSGGVIVLIAFILSLFFMPSCAFAAWHSNEPEGENITPYLIVGAVVVTAAVVYMIIKHKHKDKDQDGAEKNKDDNASLSTGGSNQNFTSATSKTNLSAALSPHNMPKLNYYLRVEDNPREYCGDFRVKGSSNVAFKAGITFGF